MLSFCCLHVNPRGVACDLDKKGLVVQLGLSSCNCPDLIQSLKQVTDSIALRFYTQWCSRCYSVITAIKHAGI